MKQVLSKSTFVYGCQCIKRLYLNKYHRDLADPMNEEQRIIFQRGTDIGLLALQLFPGGANAQGDQAWHSHLTVQRTEKLLPVNSIIYEAAFMHNEVLCAVDILVRKGNAYYAYEVKGTNSVKSQHITDAALQYYVLSNAGIQLADFSIIHFNNQYTRIGAINVNELFTATSVLEQVITEQPFISAKVDELKLVLSNKVMPEIEPGAHCEKPYPCNFGNYCGVDREEEEFDIPTHANINYDKKEVCSFMKDVAYPIYFLDFETIMYGVPEFDYSTPYQQIPFQYSLHVLMQKNGAMSHHFYLGDGITDPREALILQLIKDIGTKGSVMVWNKSFEKSCLEKMALQFPKYNKDLTAIIERMIDLMSPYQKKHIISDAFLGSYSIKYVLPAMAPELSYSDLPINNGTLASATYGELPTLKEEDQAVKREELLTYCHLDTLAMVKIWQRMEKDVTCK